VNDRSLIKFIEESNRIEGIFRPAEQEIGVYQNFLSLPVITVQEMEYFVATIQPGIQLRRRVGMDVRVGNHIPIRGGPEIEIRLTELLNRITNPPHNTAYETHLAYEDLHPFMDVNGRSGRALWLWQKGGIVPRAFLHQFYYDTLSRN